MNFFLAQPMVVFTAHAFRMGCNINVGVANMTTKPDLKHIHYPNLITTVQNTEVG